MKNAILQLIDLIPEKVRPILVSSLRPIDIIERLQLINSSCAVLLLNTDVWRYENHPVLMNYFNNSQQRIYIATLGYENKKLSHNVIQFSFPYFYFTRPRNDIPLPKLDKICEYGFSCLNNKSSFHRIILGHNLYKNNLLDNIIFSQNILEWPQQGSNIAEIIENLPLINEYRSLLPLKWPNETSDNFIKDHFIDHDAYHHSYCNIPTESEIQDFIYEGPILELPIITEKSYKPFRSMQVPLFFSAKGHMRYLNNLGFEVMEDLVPLGYDNMGIFDKADCIVEIVKKGKDYIQDFYYSHLREIQHNFDLINSDQLDQKIYSSIQEFLEL